MKKEKVCRAPGNKSIAVVAAAPARLCSDDLSDFLVCISRAPTRRYQSSHLTLVSNGSLYYVVVEKGSYLTVTIRLNKQSQEYT